MADSTSLSTTGAEPVLPAIRYRGLHHFSIIPPSSISTAELRRLYRDLAEQTTQALDRELSALTKPAAWSDPDFSSILQKARQIGTLTVTIDGKNGERASASSADILDDDKLPDGITAILFDSAAAIQTENFTPFNRFKLSLDFTEPPGFAAYDPWSRPTPNNSHLEVVGPDSTWVTGVHESTLAFFLRRQKRRSWLHNPYTFNLLNYLLGFPGALWVIYRLDTVFISRVGQMHGSIRGVLYIYVFLLVLLVFRTGVWGLRWMFPVMEIEGSRSTKTRLIIGTALSSLVLGLVYDVLKTLLT